MPRLAGQIKPQMADSRRPARAMIAARRTAMPPAVGSGLLRAGDRGRPAPHHHVIGDLGDQHGEHQLGERSPRPEPGAAVRQGAFLRHSAEVSGHHPAPDQAARGRCRRLTRAAPVRRAGRHDQALRAVERARRAARAPTAARARTGRATPDRRSGRPKSRSAGNRAHRRAESPRHGRAPTPSPSACCISAAPMPSLRQLSSTASGPSTSAGTPPASTCHSRTVPTRRP